MAIFLAIWRPQNCTCMCKHLDNPQKGSTDSLCFHCVFLKSDSSFWRLKLAMRASCVCVREFACVCLVVFTLNRLDLFQKSETGRGEMRYVLYVQPHQCEGHSINAQTGPPSPHSLPLHD